jgi:hypothetical protein
MPHHPPIPEGPVLLWTALPKLPKSPKSQRPPFDDMLRALERSSPGYGARLTREAADWPRQDTNTMTVLRRRVAEDWDALPADQRSGSQDEGQDRPEGAGVAD